VKTLAVVEGSAGADIVRPLGLATGEFVGCFNVGVTAGLNPGAMAGFVMNVLAQIGDLFDSPTPAYGGTFSPCES